MACERRRADTDTLDVKINQQKATSEKSKVKYEAEKETFAELIKLYYEMRKELLTKAVRKSNHSYAAILEFIKEKAEAE